MQSLGDRMKRYESVSNNQLIKKVPVIIRVDGKAFHTLTRGLEKPFDERLIECMVEAAKAVAHKLQGFKAAYIQSDEASFLLSDLDTINTEAYFDYKINKINSIVASTMSVYFNRYAKMYDLIKQDNIALFDCRCFNVPEDDIANYFLWRAKDWERNSLQMYSRAFFSHKDLHKKNRQAMHDMLHSIGKNWATDLDNQKKNGTWIFREEEKDLDITTITCDVLPHHKDIKQHIEPLLQPKEQDANISTE